MGIIFEFLIQIIFEVICWAVAEALAETGLNALEKVVRNNSIGPVFRGFTYAAVGILFGIISYFILPGYVFENKTLRITGLILGTIIMGLMACLFSGFISRRKLDLPFWSTEKFIHGAVFGISYFLSRGFAVG